MSGGRESMPTRSSERRVIAFRLASRAGRDRASPRATARELGYYDVPRTGSLAEVAAVLECSESAASTLLRTVESKLVDAALRR